MIESTSKRSLKIVTEDLPGVKLMHDGSERNQKIIQDHNYLN